MVNFIRWYFCVKKRPIYFLQKCLFGSLFIAVIAMTSIQGKSDLGVFVKLQKTIRNKSLLSNFNVNRFDKNTDDMLFRRKLFITTNCTYFWIHKTLVRNFPIDFFNHVNSFLFETEHAIISYWISHDESSCLFTCMKSWQNSRD